MEINNNCVPQLRFPGFVGEWEMFTMEDLFDIRNGYTPSKYNPEFWEGGTIPWFRMEDIRQNGHILSDSIQHVTPAAVKGAGLFPAYSIIVATTATIGEHALIIADSLANQRFTFLTKRKSHDNKLDMLYFHQYMFIIDEWCKKNTNAGGLLSVNMQAFKKLSIPLPSLEEQNEIVECLEAEDRMIAAQEQKVESLKVHKIGLMQQLFPQPGATTPALRFPGFTGDWQEKSFDGICHTITPPLKLQSSQYSSSGKFPIVDQSQTLICGWTNDSSGLLRNAPYIIFGDHTCVLKYIDFPFIQGADGVKILGSNKKDNSKFIYQLLLSNPVKQDGYKRHFSDLKEKIFLLPPSLEEQTKIAECLSSIDEIISIEESKVASLKSYKKGLMQQLFPQPEK